eukprot:125590-Chlamydomonas_euryale.AAC.1
MEEGVRRVGDMVWTDGISGGLAQSCLRPQRTGDGRRGEKSGRHGVDRRNKWGTGSDLPAPPAYWRRKEG